MKHHEHYSLINDTNATKRKRKGNVKQKDKDLKHPYDYAFKLYLLENLRKCQIILIMHENVKNILL